MPVTTLSITGTFDDPDLTNETASGTVTFTPTPTTIIGGHFVNNGVMIPIEPITKTLASGVLPSTTLVRCVGGYTVVEQINGAPAHSYTIPDQAGPVDLSSFS